MATFKRLTDLEGEPLYVNLDSVHLMYRLVVGDTDPYDESEITAACTRLVFQLDDDSEEGSAIYRDVLETPHSIVG